MTILAPCLVAPRHARSNEKAFNKILAVQHVLVMLFPANTKDQMIDQSFRLTDKPLRRAWVKSPIVFVTPRQCLSISL
jgi:hypothetical protein